jgi:hydroxymethylglutaryl-CoA reductase
MRMARTSRISGFYQLTVDERAEIVAQWAGLTPVDASALQQGLAPERAERMIENVAGVYALPLGIAANFLINNRDYLIPMVIEEPSVVAGASFAARLARMEGGFEASSTDPVMIGQIQVVGLSDPLGARDSVLAAKNELLELAHRQDPVLAGLGGGARDLEAHVFPQSATGPMLVLHLRYDVRDAMGANAVNTACEALAPRVEEITGGRVVLRILSNLADQRRARASCSVPAEALARDGFTGEMVVQRVLEAHALATVDPYRAATHNKGIMNGIDALAVATGNDWRAVEAGAHAFAARHGTYEPLSHWERDTEGRLAGTLELPLAVGIVGGATRAHPVARLALKILGVESARELAEVMCAVGLAQNLAALRALATEGIQRGHMELHARQVAISAGAEGELIERVAQQMVAERVVRPDRAAEILAHVAQDADIDGTG